MDDLKRIARNAMRERGLLPDFSAEALVQTSSLTAPARTDGPGEVRRLHPQRDREMGRRRHAGERKGELKCPIPLT